MAQILPFRALRYNLAKVRPAQVLTEPYDKITPEMQRRYLAASPYNLITLEKAVEQPPDNASDNVYTRAARVLGEWKAKRILVEDPEPSLYVYAQRFVVPGGSELHTRKGLIALGRLEDYSAGVIFRHEQTLLRPKADRLELLRHTHTQTGQLFLLYDDATRRTDALVDQQSQALALTGFADEFGVEHSLWRISDARVISEFQAELARQKLVIADGHHRYETALAYRNERRAAGGLFDANSPWEYAMMTLVNARSEGLVILATHRVVFGLERFVLEELASRLAPFFDVSRLSLPADARRPAAAREALGNHGSRAIGAYSAEDGLWLFRLNARADLAAAIPEVSPRLRQLDVSLLHGLILRKGLGITAEAVGEERHLRYERDAAVAMAEVDAGRAQAVFLLRPVAVEQVVDLALAGQVLPQKSTDFYPKLLSGMTMYAL